MVGHEVFIQQPNNQVVFDGEPVVLRCKVKDTVSKNYSLAWLEGSTKLKSNERRYEVVCFVCEKKLNPNK